jgi:hypothetical protein
LLPRWVMGCGAPTATTRAGRGIEFDWPLF